MLMYFICKAVDMAPQPIRCLWSGDNKHLKKKKKKKKKIKIKKNKKKKIIIIIKANIKCMDFQRDKFFF